MPIMLESFKECQLCCLCAHLLKSRQSEPCESCTPTTEYKNFVGNTAFYDLIAIAERNASGGGCGEQTLQSSGV